MKHIIIIAVAFIAALTSCRTSEANYRAAYEQAVNRRDDTPGIDKTVYDKIRREAVSSTRVVGGDTIAVKRERVKLAEPAEGETMQQSYVVVAQFKQLFNARSLCSRLKAGGYPDATLLVTREPLYYVAVAGGSVDAMNIKCVEFAANPAVAVKPPYPLVLEPAK